MRIQELEDRFRFALAQLGERNRHHAFEELCEAHAAKEFGETIIPSSGPVSAGGDGGADFQGLAHDNTRTTYICSTQRKNTSAKIQSDIRKLQTSDQIVGRVRCYLSETLQKRARDRVEAWARTEHSIELQVIDGRALAISLARDHSGLGSEYLEVFVDAGDNPRVQPDVGLALQGVRLGIEALGLRILEHSSNNREFTFRCDWLRTDENGRALNSVQIHGAQRLLDQSLYNSWYREAHRSGGADIVVLLAADVVPNLRRHSRDVVVATLEQFPEILVDLTSYLVSVQTQALSRVSLEYYVEPTLREEEHGGSGRQRELSATRFLEPLLEHSNSRLLWIVGDFGAGKTWLANMLAWRLATDYQERKPGSKVPLLISVAGESRRLSAAIDDAVSRMARELRVQASFVTNMIRGGKFIVILDGLDDYAHRVELVHTVQDDIYQLTARIHESSKFIVFSRTNFLYSDYASTLPRPRSWKPLSLDAASYVTVARMVPFDEQRIRLALKKRYPGRANEIWANIDAVYDLGGLAGRPVLFDLLKAPLPKRGLDQVTIYRKYFAAESRRGYSSRTSRIRPTLRRELLRMIAWKMFSGDEPRSEVSVVEVVALISDVLDDHKSSALQTGVAEVVLTHCLSSTGRGSISFAHASYREFLVAEWVASKLDTGCTLSQELGARINIVCERLYHRGIFKFIRQLIHVRGEQTMIAALRSSSSWERLLAAYLLGRPRSRRIRRTIRELLGDALEKEHVLMVRREIAIALCRLDFPEPLQSLLRELEASEEERERIFEQGYFAYHQDRGGPVEELHWRLNRGIDRPLWLEYFFFLQYNGNTMSQKIIESLIPNLTPLERPYAERASWALAQRFGIETYTRN